MGFKKVERLDLAGCQSPLEKQTVMADMLQQHTTPLLCFFSPSLRLLPLKVCLLHYIQYNLARGSCCFRVSGPLSCAHDFVLCCALCIRVYHWFLLYLFAPKPFPTPSSPTTFKALFRTLPKRLRSHHVIIRGIVCPQFA